MLCYDRIDITKGIDLAKSNNSKECMICCHYWFFNHGFKFPDYVCNDCHDLSMLGVIVIATVTIKNVDYHCIIHKQLIY